MDEQNPYESPKQEPEFEPRDPRLGRHRLRRLGSREREEAAGQHRLYMGVILFSAAAAAIYYAIRWFA